MNPVVTYEELLTESEMRKRKLFIDVRTPNEYAHATIPGAVNIPVLDNHTREKVGTLYVKGQIEEAKQVGLEWASSQLPDMYQRYQQYAGEYDELVLFCSRGGMRSSAIFSLLKALGLPVRRLKGGYKAYRHYIISQLDVQLSNVRFVTLYGLSGTGKTDVLKELANQGAQVLDIEACANHRGSLLGGIGLSPPHSQKMFESLLFEESRHWGKGSVVFTEGESKRIGPVVMPESLYQAIQTGDKLLIEATLEKRVEQIHKDYIVGNDVQELIETLEYMKKFMNKDRVCEMQQQLKNNQWDKVIERLLLSYYDPRYSYRGKVYLEIFSNEDEKATAQEILNWLKTFDTHFSKC